MASVMAALISDWSSDTAVPAATKHPDVFTSIEGGTSREVHLLVERARSGDADAWEVLYRRAYPRLLAYARRRLPSTELARDAVGEAVTRAVAGIGRFRGQGAGFDAWLYGILRHVVIDAQRRSRREGAGLVPDQPDLAAGPGETVLGREEAQRLRTAFGLLSAEDREILELRVVAGLSSEEVAAALGRRPGAVRMAQSRALARLRALLEANEAEGPVAVA